LNFGVFDAEGALCGYARVVTDRATFAWLCDAYIDRLPGRPGGDLAGGADGAGERVLSLGDRHNQSLLVLLQPRLSTSNGVPDAGVPHAAPTAAVALCSEPHRVPGAFRRVPRERHEHRP
jgi:hypothetical protein